jgi:virginiamycin A acetyltransferase
MLEKLQWWNKSIDEINSLIPILTSSDLENVKIEIKKLLNIQN